MKRFVWRLQRVLDVRAKQEQVKRTELYRRFQELFVVYYKGIVAPLWNSSCQ